MTCVQNENTVALLLFLLVICRGFPLWLEYRRCWKNPYSYNKKITETLKNCIFTKSDPKTTDSFKL